MSITIVLKYICLEQWMNSLFAALCTCTPFWFSIIMIFVKCFIIVSSPCLSVACMYILLFFYFTIWMVITFYYIFLPDSSRVEWVEKPPPPPPPLGRPLLCVRWPWKLALRLGETLDVERERGGRGRDRRESKEHVPTGKWRPCSFGFDVKVSCHARWGRVYAAHK